MPHSPLPVYLIHWDAPDWCRRSVESLLTSTDVDLDLTVVDNGQTHGPPLAEVLPPTVRILAAASNRGYTGGANAALEDWRRRLPGSEFCVIGSHDLHVEPQALAALLAVAEKRPDCGIASPALTGPVVTSGGMGYGTRSVLVALDGVSGVVERDWASGTCMLIRRRCADGVGAFDERLGSYGEDVDYGRRARDLGWKVLVVTSARAHGLGSSAADAVGRKTVNGVLLSAKADGLRGAASSLAAVGLWATRGFAASVLPWRSAERRRVSRTAATARAGALAELLTGGRHVGMLRDRSGRRRPAAAPAPAADDPRPDDPRPPRPGHVVAGANRPG